MKKYLLVLMAIVLCGGFFVGCKNNVNYWETTFSKAEAFMAVQTNDFALSSSLTFTKTILTENTEIAEYEQLKNHYVQILHTLMFQFKQHYGSLQLKPSRADKQTQKYFKALNDKIDDLQTAINYFLAQKDIFENNISNNLSEEHSLTQLKILKREFKTLILQASEFNSEFAKLYLYAYKEIPRGEIQTAFLGLDTLVATETMNTLIKTYIAYAFDDTDIISLNVETSIFSKAIALKEALANPSAKTNLVDLFNDLLLWKATFETELENFNFSLSQVNLKEYYKNPSSYIESHNTQLAFIENILNFNAEIVALYTNKVLNLIV